MSGAHEIPLIAGKTRLHLEDGTTLRLLTAWEVLGAKSAARTLEEEGIQEAALCSNACILAAAWEKKGAPICADGKEMLQKLSVSQIQRLAKTWAQFDREENPSVTEEEGRLDALKKAWSTRPRRAFTGVCSKLLARFPRKSG